MNGFLVLEDGTVFEGESVAETLGLLFSRSADPGALPADVTPGIRALIARCELPLAQRHVARDLRGDDVALGDDRLLGVVALARRRVVLARARGDTRLQALIGTRLVWSLVPFDRARADGHAHVAGDKPKPCRTT